MNGIIYCGVSSKEQIEGTSLESQELPCRCWHRGQCGDRSWTPHQFRMRIFHSPCPGNDEFPVDI